MYHLSQLTPILFSPRLYYLLILHFYEKIRIGPNTQHSSYLPHTLPLTYISHSISTKHITIKNNHPILPNQPSISLINFLKFIMTTLCSSVIIIIVHRYTIIVTPLLFHYTRTIKDNYSIYNIYATFHQFIIIS